MMSKNREDRSIRRNKRNVKTPKKREEVLYEYLYIEEPPLKPMPYEEKSSDTEVQRGVIIIELM